MSSVPMGFMSSRPASISLASRDRTEYLRQKADVEDRIKEAQEALERDEWPEVQRELAHAIRVATSAWELKAKHGWRTTCAKQGCNERATHEVDATRQNPPAVMPRSSQPTPEVYIVCEAHLAGMVTDLDRPVKIRSLSS